MGDDAIHIQLLEQYVGHLTLDEINMRALQPFIERRKESGCKTKTINLSLQIIRHLLNLAAYEWIDEFGLSWLESAPKIKLLAVTDAKRSYVLTWEEQEKLFFHLASHLKDMAEFAINTGCRDAEVCSLEWYWEYKIPKLNINVFIIPEHIAKNKQERVIILNKKARDIIEKLRGKHSKHVFIYKSNRVRSMNNNGWSNAWKKAGLPLLDNYTHGVHTLRHTFGSRLRTLGVSEEDRKDLLGHKSKTLTTHYSSAQIDKLVEAAEKLCNIGISQPSLTMVKIKSGKSRA